MTDSKISFSKEIASTIGLEEAILFEHIKQQEKLHDHLSIQQIIPLNAEIFPLREKMGSLREKIFQVVPKPSPEKGGLRGDVKNSNKVQ